MVTPNVSELLAVKLNAGHSRAVVLFEDLGDKGHHGDEDTVVYDHAGPMNNSYRFRYFKYMFLSWGLLDPV